MSDKETPFGLKKTRKGCGCSGSNGVTILNIGGKKVGIRGMKEIFEDLKEKEISPDEVDKDELIERFREDNYIPTKKEKNTKKLCFQNTGTTSTESIWLSRNIKFNLLFYIGKRCEDFILLSVIEETESNWAITVITYT